MEAKSSRALQVNLQDYRVDVTVDPKYYVIRDVMSRYDGLQKVLDTFLTELCHPRKNRRFIVNEARTFSLGYFYDLKTHPKGPDAARLYVDIAVDAVENATETDVRIASFHNLYLLLQRFIKEGGPELERFLPVIYYGFDRMREFTGESFALAARGYYQLNRLAAAFLENAPPGADFRSVNSLLVRYFEYTFSYWLSEDDPAEWFEREISRDIPAEISGFFSPVSHAHLAECRTRLREITDSQDENSPATLKALLDLPGYGDIAGVYKGLPDRIFKSVGDEKLRHQYKLIFLFHNMNIAGLSGIHEDTLREINRSIAWLISHEDPEDVQRLIEKTFGILKDSVDKFPDTVLKTVLNMGKGVYRTDESDLVSFFNRSVVLLGFQTPDFRGISEDWQIRSNHAHLQNIRTWMELIALNPKWSKKLLSSLIIHLSLSGVLIKDTDLFPRDITAFLNSDIRPVYNLVKQLMRLFPAYFNEIGAEGQLRDISTRIDEICKRRDILIHFLRKQSHVESSNKTVSLIEAVLDFWRTKSKNQLKQYLPQNIYERIDTRGEYIDGVSRVMNYVFQSRGLARVTDLLLLGDDYLPELRERFPEGHETDIERVALAIAFYRLLYRKYNRGSYDIDDYIAHAQAAALPLKLNGLKQALSERDTFSRISGLLDCLKQLKKVILSSDKFEIREDIYRKRHIAADIPSMYGSYSEAKFDAMGLTLRLESLVNALFEELIEEFDLDFITHATFYRIYECLRLF
ncbi:MAG: pyruvate, phosphate dikinase, partial [Deferribacteres bacterium]|nr:pyruvate, phosphate dikinase [Deferribacteres bacterium]